jgi:hypothetical protein
MVRLAWDVEEKGEWWRKNNDRKRKRRWGRKGVLIKGDSLMNASRRRRFF